MPYLAMIDQFRSFLRKRRATLVICGFSFGDEHLEDVLLQELEGNPTAAAFALMFGKLEDHPRAVALAEQRPNLSIYARDGGVVGTQRGRGHPTMRARRPKWAWATSKSSARFSPR